MLIPEFTSTEESLSQHKLMKKPVYPVLRYLRVDFRLKKSSNSNIFGIYRKHGIKGYSERITQSLACPNDFGSILQTVGVSRLCRYYHIYN